MDKKYLSKLTFGQNIYDLKDADARREINDLKSAVTGAMHWVGLTTTQLSDGSQTNPITVGGQSYTASSGDVAAYDDGTKTTEFAFNGTLWQEFGSTGSIKGLAFKDNATGDVICAGVNAQSNVTFSGTTTDTVLGSVNDAAVLPSFTEGQFSAGTLPSLGSATTGLFATEGIVATVNEQNEILTLSSATTSSAVTAQGSFNAGTLPSKASDTFNPGSAATFNTQSVVTGIGTAVAAGQVFSGATVTVTVS